MAEDEKAAEIIADENKPMFDEAQQAFINDIISKRMSEVNSKHAKEIKDLNAQHKTDLERSKMDEATRLKAEADDAMAKMTERAEAAERALRVTSAQADLAKRGLPTELAEYMLGADTEATTKNIDAVAKMIDEAVQARVNEKIHTGAPQAPSGGSSDDELLSIARKAAHLD